MTAAGYYDQSYPPSLWRDTLHANVVSGVSGGVAITGIPVVIIVHDGSGNTVSEFTVDWGDGTSNSLSSHSYSTPATGVVIVVTVGSTGSVSLPPFDVHDPTLADVDLSAAQIDPNSEGDPADLGSGAV